LLYHGSQSLFGRLLAPPGSPISELTAPVAIPPVPAVQPGPPKKQQ
jgi:hypothetical protein